MIYSQALLPAFPLFVHDEEGVTEEFADAQDVASTLEFYDDWADPDDTSVRVRDADGRDVRLLVYAADVFACHVVPAGFSVTDLTVDRIEVGPGDALIEHLDWVASRMITESATALPANWDDTIKVSFAAARRIGVVDPQEFHHRWTRLRGWPI